MLLTHSGEKLPQEAPGLRCSPWLISASILGEMSEREGEALPHTLVAGLCAPEALLGALGRCGWHI